MDQNALIDQNCEDDIPQLEVRKSPDENSRKASSEEDKDPFSAPDKPIRSETFSEVKERQHDLTSTIDKVAIKEKDVTETPSEVDLSVSRSDSTTEPNKESESTLINQNQKKPTVVSEERELMTTTDTTVCHPQSSDIKFTNPLGNNGSEQKIKVDDSQSILSSAPVSDATDSGHVRKLVMCDTPEAAVKQEDDYDDVKLQCDEKIGDSPELETKQQTRIPSILSQEKEVEDQSLPVVNLLQPLQVDETVNESRPDISFSLNEFGLVEVPRLIKGEIKKETVTASPRKDNIGRRIQDDNIMCCEGCGCYGMAGEFVAANSCSAACTRAILEKVRERQRREREAAKQKQRRDAKMGHRGERYQGGLKTTHYNEEYPWHEENGFEWQKYLEWSNSNAAPSAFFKGDPFPPAHKFSKMMKLEAIDPQNPSCICVVSVAEEAGPRLRLHFDGYSDSYDFWENANSENLFPVGWCLKNNQCLVPPKGMYLSSGDFSLIPFYFQDLLLPILTGSHTCQRPSLWEPQRTYSSTSSDTLTPLMAGRLVPS